MITSLLVLLDAVVSDAAADTAVAAYVVEKLMGMAPDEIIRSITAFSISLVGKLLKIAFIWYVGRWIIRRVVNVVKRIMLKHSVNPSVNSFVSSIIDVVSMILIIIMIIGVIDRFQPTVPILRVLHLVEKVVHILIRVNVFMVTFQHVLKLAQLQHGMIHGNENDFLGCHAAGQKRFNHLILDSGFPNAPGSCQHHSSSDILIFQFLHCFVKSESLICFRHLWVHNAGPPPWVVRRQNL